MDADGIIELDSEFAQKIGFTSDKFDGYLWRDGDRVLISFIWSKQPGEGNFSDLIEAIEELDLRVAVPSPLPQMQQILEAKGFVPRDEEDEHLGVVDVWMKGDDAEERAAAYRKAELESLVPFIRDVMVKNDPTGMDRDAYLGLVIQQYKQWLEEGHE